MIGGNGGHQFRQYAGQNARNLNGYNAKEEAGIQLQAEEYYLMAAAADLDKIKEVNPNCILMANLQQASSSGDLDEIEEVNANCILMENLQQASTYGTQHDRAPVYDTDGSAE
nr:hypothetical protein [Tanacetum cinerariifolium]